MNLLLKRTALRDTYTIGKLYVDGQYWCDTLEDRVRDLTREKKVPGETAIPAGTYDVVVNVSPKFKRLLPRLLRVPHFEGILIHRGNYAGYREFVKSIPANGPRILREDEDIKII
jgi:hypothetical protein